MTFQSRLPARWRMGRCASVSGPRFGAGHGYPLASCVSHRLKHLFRCVDLGELLVVGNPAQVDDSKQCQQKHDARQHEGDDRSHQGDLAEGREGVGLEEQSSQRRALEDRGHLSGQLDVVRVRQGAALSCA